MTPNRHARNGRLGRLVAMAAILFCRVAWADSLFSAPSTPTAGLAFDGSTVFLNALDGGTRTIWRLAPGSGAVLGSLPGAFETADLEYDGGGRLFRTNFVSNQVEEVDAVSGAPLGSFSVPFRPGAIAFDGALLYVFDLDTPLVLVTDRVGAVVTSFLADHRAGSAVWDASVGRLLTVELFGPAIRLVSPAGTTLAIYVGPHLRTDTGLSGITIVGTSLYIVGATILGGVGDLVHILDTACGDGRIGPGETCDDGTPVDGDGCSATCQLEAGWTCSAVPSVCTSICGDGVVVGSEACDDGNTLPGDCCSALCESEVGSPCADDGSLCSTDACDGAGTCTHTFAPDPGCLLPVESGKAQLKLAAETAPAPDQVQFKWSKGPVVTKADFGAPDATTTYELCVYDETAGVPSLAFKARPQMGGTCDDRPCWSEKPTGWSYKATSGLPDGIVSVKLGEGLIAGKAKVQVKAKGTLALAALPLDKDPRVSAEVRTSSGQCFGARFSAVKKNDIGRFSAKSE
jgi:cysteine-rich repeat protein